MFAGRCGPLVVATAASVATAAIAATAATAATGVTAATAATAAPGDIDAGNVAQLQLHWSLRSGQVGAVDTPPAAADGLLFVITPFPHTLSALDPAAPAERRIRWRFTPPDADRSAAGLSCCERIRHGPVVAAGRVFFTTLDGHVIALDAATGGLRFDARVADVAAGETLVGAPLVADGRVFVGSAGGDFGARGWIAALDAGSGATLWKRFSTGPDGDVGIGPEFKPFHARLGGKDLGTSTWPPAAWQQGGGSVAGDLLYDADAKAVLHATGHPAPWNAEQRPGDNRWTSGLFARDAATGAARWFVGFNPHNPFAFHDAGSGLLMDRAWQGANRRLVVHPDANGMLYVVDRTTGQLLAADAIGETVVAGVDVASGETRYAVSKSVAIGRQTRGVCPAWTGAFGAGASAVGQEGIVALPLARVCMDIEPRPANFIRGTPYAGANVRLMLKAPNAGAVVGWNLPQRRPAWRVEERWPVLGATHATASGLVLYGTLDGKLKALDGRNGKLLWQFQAPAAIVGRPLVFRGSDGRQYLAVVAGAGRLHGLPRTESLDPRDAGAGFGLAGLLQQLPRDADASGTLLVFGPP